MHISFTIGNDSNIQHPAVHIISLCVPVPVFYGGVIMDKLALILSIIGSLNWGLVGIFQFDLVAWIFGGQDAVISRIIYSIIALAGLWCISLLFRKRNDCCIDGE